MPHHMFTLQFSSRALRVDETQASSGCQAGRVGIPLVSLLSPPPAGPTGAPPAPHGTTDAPSSPDVNHKKKERGSRGTALRNVVFSQEIYLTTDKGPCGKQTSQCCACYHCLRLPSLPFLSHTLTRLQTPHWKTPFQGICFLESIPLWDHCPGYLLGSTPPGPAAPPNGQKPLTLLTSIPGKYSS